MRGYINLATGMMTSFSSLTGMNSVALERSFWQQSCDLETVLNSLLELFHAMI